MQSKFIQWFRILTGIMLVVFFFMWLFAWQPPDVPPAAQKLRDGLIAAGYFFPLICITYLLVGAAYLTNRFVPLATIVLFPITLNIVLYHLFLIPATLLRTAVLAVPNAVMIYACWDVYKPLLKAKT
jgi:putative oxidoreductase